MVCLGLKPRVAGWQAQKNPLSYGGTPTTNCQYFCFCLSLVGFNHSSFLTEAINSPSRHSSVQSSAPTIMPPRVRVPSTPSMLFRLQYLCYICPVKRTKINKKEAGFGLFEKNKLPFCPPIEPPIFTLHGSIATQGSNHCK